MKTVHLETVTDGGCPYNRQILPARHCAADLAARGVRISAGMYHPPDAAVIGMHGLPVPGAERRIMQFKRNGGKFLWSLDDDHPAIPPWNPSHMNEEAQNSWHLAKLLADFILVSTPALADTFGGDPRVLVTPNLVDLAEFPAIPANRVVELPVRVCWVGSYTHRGDVEVMEAAVSAILKRFDRREVAVVWMGQPPPNDLMRDWLNRGLSYQPGVPFSTYHRTLGSLKPDVYLCPLAEVDFNLSKSNLRIMEAWTLGAVPVASPVGEYCEIRHGIDGLLADTTEKWVAAVSRLVTDHQFRLSLALSGRKRVETDYNWLRPECRVPWVESFVRMTENEVPAAVVSP